MEASKTYRAKVSPQGQVTIPVAVRKQLSLEKGHYVTFYVSDGGIVLTKKLPIEEFFGKVNVLNGMDPVEFSREYRRSFSKNITT